MADRVVKYVFRGDISGLRTSMAAAGKGVGDLGNKITATDAKSAKFRSGLTSVGNAAGKAGLVAAAGFGAMVVSAAKFDKAMSGVRAATHETAGNMDRLRAAALKAGADTAFSATEAADGIEQLAKAGVSTRDILSGGLTGALDLAAAGSMAVGDAAEVAATALTQFKLQGSDIPHVADLLAAAAGKAQGEVSDMASALKQGGLVAHGMGLSIEETTGALGAFASAGLLGSDAGTSLKTMIQRLQAPVGTAAKLMEELNLSAYNAQGRFIGLSQFAGQLQNRLGDMTDQQRNAALATIFGSDAVRAATVIYDQGAKGIGGWIDKVNDQGFAAETAAIKLDNLSGDVEALKGSLETLAIGGGDGSQGMLRGLVQGATDASNALNDLPDPVKSLTANMLGLVAVMGGATWFGAKAVGAVAGMRTSIEALGVSAKGSSAAMAGLGKSAGILAAVFAADEASKMMNASNLTMTTYIENLRQMADTGRATETLSHLGFAVGSLGEELHRAKFSDFAKFTHQADDIEDMDAALSKMSTGTAAQAFEVIIREGRKAGLTLEEINSLFPKYTVAQEKATRAADLQRNAQRTVGRALEESADGAHHAAREVETHTDAMRNQKMTVDELVGAIQALNHANLTARGTERAYQAAVDAATASLKDNGRTLNINTERGRANSEALDSIAESAAQHAESMQADGRSIKAVNGFLQQSRHDLIEAAIHFGLTRKQAREYANQVLQVPKSTKTTPKFDKAAATRDVDNFVSHVKSGLRGIKDEQVVIRLSAQAAHVQSQLDKFSGGNAAGRFATGGSVRGPGTGTSDDIPAMLSNGEHVLTAKEVRAMGGHRIVELWRKAALKGALPDPRDLPKFARGGAVNSDVRLWMPVDGSRFSLSAMQSSIDRLGARISAAMSKKASDFFTHMPTTGNPLGFGGSLSPAQLVRGMAFARSQVGKPYIWGGVGPGGYDCSGYQSAILNAAHGRNPYQRVGTTGSSPWGGSAPGVGRYTIGYFKGSPGHMSGNIGGMNVESAGGVGTRVGGAARSPMSSMFSGRFHYATGGAVEVPAILQRDEYVLNRDAVRRVGVAQLDAINARRYHDGGLVQRFASGGSVRKRFDLNGGMSTRGVAREFDQFAKAVGGASKRLNRLEREATGVAKAYNAHARQVASLRAGANELRTAASGTFNNEIFGGGASGMLLQLKADTNDARAMSGALRTLGRKGISRSLASALAQSGDLDTARQLARMTRGRINQFDAAYAGRAQAQRTLGGTAANVAFGRQIKAQTAQMRRLDRRLEGLERAVERGARRGVRDRDQKAVHRRRPKR